MKKKSRVAVLFGGKSAEHEISLQSTQNVVEAIDKNKYDLVLIGIDHDGKWYLQDPEHFLINMNSPRDIKLAEGGEPLAIVPGKDNQQFISLTSKKSIGNIDVVFPVLHGTYGEDGTVQGLLKLLNIPFVGASVLGSAVAMDKEVSKRLLKEAGIPQVKFLAFTSEMFNKKAYFKVQEYLGIPCFIKPANLGSSVGISKIYNEMDFYRAADNAFRYDNKIIIEEFIDGREIECSVLGNEDPVASIPGEIIPQYDFYSYEAKYLDENGAQLVIPAQLENEMVNKIQNLALSTFKILCCEGMARVDFFLKEENLYLNEINTIPGFTQISMYPKLWEMSEISYTVLIDRLIQLALNRFEREKKLNHIYQQ